MCMPEAPPYCDPTCPNCGDLPARRQRHADLRLPSVSTALVIEALEWASYDRLNRLTAKAPGGPLLVAGTLNEPATVTIATTPAAVDPSNTFRGLVPTVAGTNTLTITARDASGNQATQQYEVDIVGAERTFTYDANGNLTSDGARTF